MSADESIRELAAKIGAQGGQPDCVRANPERLLAYTVERAKEVLRQRDEVAADSAFDTVPDYACGRPDADAIELASLVVALFDKGAGPEVPR